ncbi:MAG: hypothetical protein ABEK12_00045, partial [Candidatus Nanohaloarchaea archaeon]
TAESGGERDVAIVTVRVAALYMTMQLTPSETTVGDPVTVSGLMNARGVEADLYIDGTYHVTLTADRTGHPRRTATPGGVAGHARDGGTRGPVHGLCHGGAVNSR